MKKWVSILNGLKHSYRLIKEYYACYRQIDRDQGKNTQERII